MLIKKFIHSLLIGLVIFLIKPVYSFSDELKKDYQEAFYKTHKLINVYEEDLGYQSNPFAYLYDSNEVERMYKFLLRQEGDFLCEDSYLFKVNYELLKNPNNPSLELIKEFLGNAENIAEKKIKRHRKQSNLLALKMLHPYLSHFASTELKAEDYNNDGERQEGQGQDQQGGEDQDQQGGEEQDQQGGEDQDQQGGEDQDQQGGEEQDQQGGEDQNQQGGEDQDQQGGEDQDQQGGQDQNQNAEQNQNFGQEQSKGQEQKDGEDDDVKWPEEIGDVYNPHTKELPPEDNGKKVVIEEVNFKAHVFGQVIYDTIIRGNGSSFQATEIPWLVEKTSIKDGVTNKYMMVYPLGKRELGLLMPTGYVPGQPDELGAEIKSTKKGCYRLYLAKDFKELKIPLYNASTGKLSSYLENIYTRPVGISIDELPEKIRIAIIHKFDPKVEHKREKVVKAITDHLIKNYLYSTKPLPETDPIAALKRGEFQCDMAAYILVSILRDIYRIPSRVVVGYKSKKSNKDNKLHSYLLAPDAGHAWVEVFINGSWRYFDPTPAKKYQEEKKEKDGKEKQDFGDWADGVSQGDDQDNQGEDADNGEEAGKDGEPGGDTQDEGEDKDDPYFFSELDQKLANLLLDDKQEISPLKKMAWKNILIYALNPFRTSHDVRNNLYIYEGVFEYARSLKDIVEEGMEIHKKAHASLPVWFDRISGKIFSQKNNDTYHGLFRMIRVLEIYKKVVDRSDIIKLISGIKKHLEDILNILDKLNSDIAKDIALVEDFKNNSSPYLWKVIKEEYGVGMIGADIPTQNLAQAIRKGELNDKKLINILYDHTDFILNSSERPGKMEVKTWMRGSLTRGQDILPLTSFSDWPNAILMRPDLDIIDNMRRGEAFLLTDRKKVYLDSKREQDESERITIVGFDTSASMTSNDLDLFQAALVTAFVCRAIEDVTSTGRPRHRILLVPFDDQVGSPIEINSANNALNLIRDYRSKLRNTGGGTDIQKFLIEAMNLIAKSQSDVRSPFDAANIVVISDGESEVDYKELRKARNAIHRDTPLQAMFVSLWSTNPELKKFARDAKQMGMDGEDLYRHFSESKIRRIVSKSRQNDLDKHRDAFYSLKQPSDISSNDQSEIINLIGMTRNKIKQLEREVSFRNAPSKKPYYHERDLSSKVDVLNKKYHQDRRLAGWLNEFRSWMEKHNIYKDYKLFELIVDDLMLNFRKTLNIGFKDLSHFEAEQLKHLLLEKKMKRKTLTLICIFILSLSFILSPSFARGQKNGPTVFAVGLLKELRPNCKFGIKEFESIQESLLEDSPSLINPMERVEAFLDPDCIPFWNSLNKMVNKAKSAKTVKFDYEKMLTEVERIIKDIGENEYKEEKARKETKKVNFEMSFVSIPKGVYENKLIGPIEISEDVDIQTTPVTQYQWAIVMDNNPSHFKTGEGSRAKRINGKLIDMIPNRPVESVSYEDIIKFIDLKNEQDAFYKYRLPSLEEYLVIIGNDPKAKGSSCLDKRETCHIEFSSHVYFNGERIYSILDNVLEFTQDGLGQKGMPETSKILFGKAYYATDSNVDKINFITRPLYYKNKSNNEIGFRLIRYKKGSVSQISKLYEITWQEEDVYLYQNYVWDKVFKIPLNKAEVFDWVSKNKDQYSEKTRNTLEYLNSYSYRYYAYVRNIDSIHLVFIPDFMLFAGFDHVRSLSMSIRGVPDLTYVEYMKNLEDLTILSGMRGKVLDVAPLVRLSNLRKLYIDIEGQGGSITNCHLLERLIKNGCEVNVHKCGYAGK